MSRASSASPPVSTLPGENGQCGYQHGMAPCLPQSDGRTCCSINGYCGSSEEYCFKSNGCQYGCIDPQSFYLSSTKVILTTIVTISTANNPSLTLSTNHTITINKLSSTNPILSLTSSSTSQPTAAASGGGLTGKTRIGVIAGFAVGGLFLIIIIIVCAMFVKAKKKSRRAKNNLVPIPLEEPAPAVPYDGFTSQAGFSVHNIGDTGPRR